MLIQRIYEDSLAQASYLIGCQATGEAIVIDPHRDTQTYVDAAEAEGLRITHVTETHIHADFVSGARELARRVGATLYLSGAGGEGWQYDFRHEPNTVIVGDGDCIGVGNLRLDVRHTPGHTPEHIVFIVTDQPASDKPMGIVTGDFIFVGDVGRPDLLEKAANVAGTMEDSARQLFRSLQKLKALPDYLQIWPGHGAGSACGKALGAVPSSTLGYERIANWAFQIEDESTFVREVLADQPEPPRYFARMKTVNQSGPLAWPNHRRLPRLDVTGLLAAREEGAWVIDLRPTREFARGHVPGSVNIPMTAFGRWAGAILPTSQEVVLLGAGSARQTVEAALRVLGLIGHDRIAGWAGGDVFIEYPNAERHLGTVPQVDPTEVAHRSVAKVLDVRAQSEWNEGHIPRASHAYLGRLIEEVGDLDRSTPIVTQCGSGSRSAIAASLLRAHGFTNVSNMTGGIGGWKKAGLPVEK